MLVSMTSRFLWAGLLFFQAILLASCNKEGCSGYRDYEWRGELAPAVRIWASSPAIPNFENNDSLEFYAVYPIKTKTIFRKQTIPLLINYEKMSIEVKYKGAIIDTIDVSYKVNIIISKTFCDGVQNITNTEIYGVSTRQNNIIIYSFTRINSYDN